MNYESVYSFSNIKRGFYDARHGKINSVSANRFEINMLEECVKLSDELKNKTYSVGVSTKFKVYYPKERDIESSTFRDKVVQHSYCDNVLYDAVAKSMIFDNYASQYGKGTLFGLNRLKHHLRHYFFSNKSAAEIERKSAGLPEVPVEKGNYADGWILKCDIRKFFANIDHEIIKEKIQKIFQNDPGLLWLSDTIIDSVNKDSCIGLPIGYQSSQLYALVLLSGLDHLIKERLHIVGYGRYVDDFYLIHKDKSYLQHCLRVIRNYLSSYGLELNEKTQIIPIKNGIDFLGFHTYITDTGKVICKVRKRSKENIKRKLRKFAKEYQRGALSIDKINESYRGWRTYALHGDSYHLVYNMDLYYEKLFGRPFN